MRGRRVLGLIGVAAALTVGGSALAIAAATHHSPSRGHFTQLDQRYGALRRAATASTAMPADIADSAQLIAPGLRAADGRAAGTGSDGWLIWAAPTLQGGLCVFTESPASQIGGVCNAAKYTRDGVVMVQPSATGTDVVALLPDGVTAAAVTSPDGGRSTTAVTNNAFHIRVPGPTQSVVYNAPDGKHTLNAEAGDAK